MIEIGHRPEIRGSVLPGIMVTMRFYCKLGLVLVTSDRGLLPSVVWTSQSTPARRMIAHFARLSPCAKTQSVTLTRFFVEQTVTNRRAEDQNGVGLLKEFLPTPTTLDQTPSDYSGLVVVAVFNISSKYVVIIRSLATRTLGILKLLKCINKTHPEPEWSRSHAYENRERRSHFTYTRAPQPCLQAKPPG